MEVNRALIVHFVEFMTIDSFKKNVSVLALLVRHILEWAIRIDVSAGKCFYKIMKKTPDTCYKTLEKLMVARCSDQVMKEIGTEQVRHILCVSLSI